METSPLMCHRANSQVNGLKIAVPNRPASSATQKRYAVENAAQHSLEQENREEGNRQEKYEQELGEERVNDKDYARSLGLLIKQRWRLSTVSCLNILV